MILPNSLCLPRCVACSTWMRCLVPPPPKKRYFFGGPFFVRRDFSIQSAFRDKLDVVQDLTKHNTMKRAPMTFCGSFWGRKFHPWEISNKNHQIQVVGWKLLETAFLGQNFDSLLSQHAVFSTWFFTKRNKRINGNDPPKQT